MEIQVVRRVRYRTKKERLEAGGQWWRDKGHSMPLPGHGTHLRLILKSTYVTSKLQHRCHFYSKPTLLNIIVTPQSSIEFFCWCSYFLCMFLHHGYNSHLFDCHVYLFRTTTGILATPVIIPLFCIFSALPSILDIVDYLSISLTMWSDSSPLVTVLYFIDIASPSAFCNAVFGL